MSAIILNAKVKLFREEHMGYEPGVIPDDKAKWLWRHIGIDADDIRIVIRYNKTKTLVRDFYDIDLLVNEPFEEVYNKWSKNKTEDLNLSDEVETEDELDEPE